METLLSLAALCGFTPVLMVGVDVTMLGVDGFNCRSLLAHGLVLNVSRTVCATLLAALAGGSIGAEHIGHPYPALAVEAEIWLHMSFMQLT